MSSHQVIITFDLDENSIKENAEKEAGRQIARQIMDEFFGASYGRAGKIHNTVSNAVEELLKADKDKIIAEAIRELVNSLSRSKIVKEKLAEAMENDTD